MVERARSSPSLPVSLLARSAGRSRRRASLTQSARPIMTRHNPIYIPRNHLVEQTIQAAVEREDFAPFDELTPPSLPVRSMNSPSMRPIRSPPKDEGAGARVTFRDT